MAQTTINIRMDQTTKDRFEYFCDAAGISVSAAFNIFAKAVVREQRIPFEISAEIPNEITLSAIDDAENNRNMIGPFDTVEEMMEALNAQA